MHTTSGMLTTIVQLSARHATPLVIVLALVLIALALAVAALVAVPAEPVTVAPFRWSA